jgi:cell division protein FtsL
MNTLTFILIIAVLIIFLCSVIYKAFGQKKEIDRLEKLVEDYRESLCEYMTQLALIRSNGNEIKKEIENAETEEELIDILGGIISRNNNRVPDNKTKK